MQRRTFLRSTAVAALAAVPLTTSLSGSASAADIPVAMAQNLHIFRNQPGPFRSPRRRRAEPVRAL
ncbi:hypothetical protein ACFV6Z_28980 [Streptomyces sp. NPDC059818]|uniref:hypothetical protein n=1 Tax=Streptomyces sp. NPDC059818 TaxID=3346962 RepID=UPI003669316C